MTATDDSLAADPVPIDSDDESEAIATPSFFSSLDEIVEPILVPSPTPFAQVIGVTTSDSDTVVRGPLENSVDNTTELPALETTSVVSISASLPVEIPAPVSHAVTAAPSSQSVSIEPTFTISLVLRTLPVKTRFEEHEIRILFNKFSRRWKTHSANQLTRYQQREQEMLKEAALVYQTDELEIQPSITSQHALSLVIHHHAQVLLGVLRDFVFTSNVPLRERLRQFHREHPECASIDDNIANEQSSSNAPPDNSSSGSDSSSDSDDDHWEAPHDRHVQELIKSPTGAAPLSIHTPIKKQYEAAFKPLHLMHDNQRFRSTPQKTPQPLIATSAYSSSLLSPGADTMSPLPVLGKKKGLTPLPLSAPTTIPPVTMPPMPNSGIANLKNAFDRNSVGLPEQPATPSVNAVSDENPDPSGLLQRMRDRCEHLDSRASIALLESVLQLMVMASHSGGNVFRDLSTECQMWTAADEVLCDELVFCANFSLLYQDQTPTNTITQRSTTASKMVVQPKPKAGGDKRKEECLVM